MPKNASAKNTTNETDDISVDINNISVQYNNITEARSAFVEYVNNNFPKNVTNIDTGKEIGISRRGIDDIKIESIAWNSEKIGTSHK